MHDEVLNVLLVGWEAGEGLAVFRGEDAVALLCD